MTGNMKETNASERIPLLNQIMGQPAIRPETVTY